jgi:hypothetical protein
MLRGPDHAGLVVDGVTAEQLVRALAATAAASAIGSSRCQTIRGSSAKNSSALITYGTDFTPIAAAVSWAWSISL